MLQHVCCGFRNKSVVHFVLFLQRTHSWNSSGAACVDTTTLSGNREYLPSKVDCWFGTSLWKFLEVGIWKFHFSVMLGCLWCKLSSSIEDMLHTLMELHHLAPTENLDILSIRNWNAVRSNKRNTTYKSYWCRFIFTVARIYISYIKFISLLCCGAYCFTLIWDTQ